MRIAVSGAGILGISTAWHLHGHGRGHEVTVVDRRPGAVLHAAPSYGTATPSSGLSVTKML